MSPGRQAAIDAGLCGWCRQPRGSFTWLCDACAVIHRDRQRQKAALARAQLEALTAAGGGKPWEVLAATRERLLLALAFKGPLSLARLVALVDPPLLRRALDYHWFACRRGGSSVHLSRHGIRAVQQFRPGTVVKRQVLQFNRDRRVQSRGVVTRLRGLAEAAS